MQQFLFLTINFYNKMNKDGKVSTDILYQKLQTKPFIILGPCVLENELIVDQIAQKIKALSLQFPDFTFIFKASFDKANRTSIHSFRGPGIEAGCAALQQVREKYGLYITTDIHEVHQASKLAHFVDILQIPAFLCRQTDLLIAAAQTNKIINVKKAQFLSGKDMKHVVAKLKESGNNNLLLTERGTMFGYNNLVVDYTGLIDMMQFGYPVVFDATHSVQKPGGLNGKSGGNSFYAPYLAKAAASIGIKGFFIETHPNPEQALSDGANMIKLEHLEQIILDLRKIHSLQLNSVNT